MYKYSQKSESSLITCHQDLQDLFRMILYEVDHSILSGHREPDEQFQLYKKGRIYNDGKWSVKKKTEVVTYRDGYNKLSRHNYNPSRAIDVMEYPIDWKDIDRIKRFAERVKIKAEGMNIPIEWGGDWKWEDYPHWQLGAA